MIDQPLRVPRHEGVIDVELLVKGCRCCRHHPRPFHFHPVTPLNESNSPPEPAAPVVAPILRASRTKTQPPRRRLCPGMVPCRNAFVASLRATSDELSVAQT